MFEYAVGADDAELALLELERGDGPLAEEFSAFNALAVADEMADAVLEFMESQTEERWDRVVALVTRYWRKRPGNGGSAS